MGEKKRKSRFRKSPVSNSLSPAFAGALPLAVLCAVLIAVVSFWVKRKRGLHGGTGCWRNWLRFMGAGSESIGSCLGLSQVRTRPWIPKEGCLM